MSVAYVTPEILKWARKRCGFSVEKIAEELRVDVSNVRDWENGNALPTMNNARKFAKKTYIPFGYLYLNKIPEIPPHVADFRGGWAKNKDTLEELHLNGLVKSFLYKKNWYENYLRAINFNVHSGEFQSKFTRNNNSKDIARDISTYLRLGVPQDEIGRSNPSHFWNMFKNKVIKSNIWLIQTSCVGSNATRSISPRTSKGLALKSDYYPLIWVNSKLQDAPKIFTLAHELAHIWVGSEGISNHSDDGEHIDKESEIEALCDEVASEILVPEDSLQLKWATSDSPENNIERLYEYYGVSRFVVARKSFYSGIIKSEQEYRSLIDMYKSRIRANSPDQFTEESDQSGSGPNFYNVLIARNGKHFVESVIGETEKNNLLLSEACQLLGVNSPSTIKGVSDFLNGVKRNVST